MDIANNGQEAIERINFHSPTSYSVVFMDLQMPVMDGYEATRLLRLDSRYVNLPIVAMTAHAMADERERCQVLGMNGHVSKPIDPEMFYAMLARFSTPGAAARPGRQPRQRCLPPRRCTPTLRSYRQSSAWMCASTTPRWRQVLLILAAATSVCA